MLPEFRRRQLNRCHREAATDVKFAMHRYRLGQPVLDGRPRACEKSPRQTKPELSLAEGQRKRGATPGPVDQAGIHALRRSQRPERRT